jgi:hypothetical protein
MLTAGVGMNNGRCRHEQWWVQAHMGVGESNTQASINEGVGKSMLTVGVGVNDGRCRHEWAQVI